MERFSIREYALQMRSDDVLKCWPFGQAKIEYVEAFLPPITVKKFKWWTDELENKAMEDKGGSMGLICPVCLVFKAASAKVLKGHVDKCLVHSSKKAHVKMKAKSRVPKKRSIVELFAVAPQVEKVYEDEDVEDDVDSNQEDQVTLATMNMNLKKMRKNGKKKAREMDTIDISFNHKDKLQVSRKIKTLNSTRSMTSSSHIIENAKDSPYAIPEQKGQSLTCYGAGKRTKGFGASKRSLGKQKSVFSFRGILKKHLKVVSGNKSTIDTFLDSSEANWCAINQPNMNTRFSGKDNIFKRRMKSVYEDSTSVETNHKQEEGDMYVPTKLNRSKSLFPWNGENENKAFSISEKQSSDMCSCVGKLNFLRPHVTDEHLLNRPLSSNQAACSNENLHRLDHSYKIGAPDPSSASPPEFVSMRKMTYNPSATTFGGQNVSMSSTSNAKVSSHHGAGPRLDATCYKDYVTSFPQLSSSSHIISESWSGHGRLQFPPDPTSEKFTGQNLQYHPIPHLSPKELMLSICSPPEMEQRGLMHLGRSINENYIGLPLNSHGEYIQLQSSGKCGYNQLLRPAIFTDSSRTLALCTESPTNQEDHLSFLNVDERPPLEKKFPFIPTKGQVKENPKYTASSSLGTTSRSDVSLDSLGESCHTLHPHKSGIDLMSIPSQCNRNDMIWNHSNDRHMYRERQSNVIIPNGTQPTMRLMGQEFSIGKNYNKLHERENVWMGNQIMVHHDGGNTANESSKRHFQPGLIQPGTVNNNKIACSSDIQINMLSQGALQIIPPTSRLSTLAVGCQTNAVNGSACRTFGGAPIPKPYPYFPSPAMLNQESSPQERFRCEFEPVNYKPVRASSSYSTYQNLSLNYAEPTRKLSQPYSTSSAFKFPFLCTDLGERVQPYNCQSSFNGMTPSLLNATQVDETMIGSFQPYSDAGSHHPCMSSNNFQKKGPLCCTPDVSHTYNPLNIQSSLQNGPDLVSIAQSPPVCPKILPTPTVTNKREYRLKFKERMKARLCVKDYPPKRRTKNRPGNKLVSSLMPTKLITQEDHGVTTTLKAIGDPEVDAIETANKLGLDGSSDVANNVITDQISTQTVASGAISETTFSGPVKLAAGAKHIFNPSECVYDTKSKLTHSKVPFTALSSSGMTSECPGKPSKIYHF